MSTILGTIILALAPQKPPNVVCNLNDCQFSNTIHQIAELPVTQDRWSWVNHDLALARTAAQRGQSAKAINLVMTLDQSIRTGLSQLLIDRGSEHVISLHEALQAIVVNCKGHPLEPLNLTMDPLARHHPVPPGVMTPAQ